MPLTPETLTRHELAGLPVRVAAADNPDLVGIVGRVAVETMRTLRVESAERRSAESDGSRVRQLPKRGTTFEFALPESERGFDAGGQSPANTDERRDDRPSRRTDEAAGDRKAPGSASELGPETAGVRSGQSGPSAPDSDSEDGATSRSFGDCEGAVYVTVDGARLLSRPALRTERASAGDSTWR